MVHNWYKIPGGEDVSTATQIELLRDNGHYVELLDDSNSRVDDIGMVRTAAKAFWSQEAHRRTERALETGRFDVVHVQNAFPLLSPSVYYAARKHRVPVVQSLRNFRLVCPEGMLHRSGRVCTDCIGKAVAWPGILHGCYRDSSLGSAVVAAHSAGHRLVGTWRRTVFRYVTPSEYARSVFTEAGWNLGQVDVIPNYVYPDPGPGTGAAGYALYVGRLAPVKGIDTLLKAWDDGGVRFPLRIVGAGPLLPEVEAAVANNQWIEYLGPVSPSEASELMGEAAMLIAPTVGIESFGRVVAEAMAKGTPSLVADHGGLRESVVSRWPELLVPPGDAAALAAKVEWLAEDDTARARLRAEVRDEYLAKYASVDRVGLGVTTGDPSRPPTAHGAREEPDEGAPPRGCRCQCVSMTSASQRLNRSVPAEFMWRGSPKKDRSHAPGAESSQTTGWDAT
jgi:glycosyltransferase involved in cell wall biosynthesis